MTQLITWTEIAAFLASLLALKNILGNKSLRLFPLLLGLVTLVEVYETFFAPANVSFNTNVYHVLIPIQFVLYLLILYYSFSKSTYKKYILVTAFVLTAFYIITTIYFTAKNRANVIGYCFGSICIICFIVLKFYEMLQNPMDFNFLRNPFFYMLFAYLLFLVGTLPYFSMSNWLYFVKGNKAAVMVLVNVMSVMNIILYSTYTIAFLWMTQKKVSY